jgi:hypothetical protein
MKLFDLLHCADVHNDRVRGAKIESNFAAILLKRGRKILAAHAETIEMLKLVDVMALPDYSHGDIGFVGVSSLKMLAEVKGKYKNAHGKYGLERYRVDGLLETQKQAGYDSVLYVIYDTREKRWKWALLDKLIAEGSKEYMGCTYRAGEKVKTIIAYWPAELWTYQEEAGS